MLVHRRTRGVYGTALNRPQAEVKRIEIGGVYRSMSGKTFAIVAKSANGSLFVGVRPNGARGYFNEDGTPADGSRNLLRWYSRSGPVGLQYVNLKNRRLIAAQDFRESGSGGGRA